MLLCFGRDGVFWAAGDNGSTMTSINAMNSTAPVQIYGTADDRGPQNTTNNKWTINHNNGNNKKEDTTPVRQSPIYIYDTLWYTYDRPRTTTDNITVPP